MIVLHWLSFVVAFIVVVVDQATKNLVLRSMYPSQSIVLIEDVLHLTYVQNTGIAFGLFQNANAVFLVLSLAILFGIIYAMLQTPHEQRPLTIFFGLLLGGAMGNIIDRFFLGYVVDFIDFRIWPVFNVADSAITVSIIGLIILLWNK